MCLIKGEVASCYVMNHYNDLLDLVNNGSNDLYSDFEFKTIERLLFEEIVKKIESGEINVNVVSSQGMATDSVEFAPRVKKTLECAVPEDVKNVIRRWASICNDLPQPMKSYLRRAKLSLNGENRLLVVVEDGIASDYFVKQEENKVFLQDRISEAVDKQIVIDMQSVKDDREFDAKYVDLTAIQFDIDEIDDDDDGADEFI